MISRSEEHPTSRSYKTIPLRGSSATDHYSELEVVPSVKALWICTLVRSLSRHRHILALLASGYRSAFRTFMPSSSSFENLGQGRSPVLHCLGNSCLHLLVSPQVFACLLSNFHQHSFECTRGVHESLLSIALIDGASVSHQIKCSRRADPRYSLLEKGKKVGRHKGWVEILLNHEDS